MDKSIDFSKNLIKGRIAEIIFEQMFREVKSFTILSFGYEHIIPELARMQHETEHNETMEILKRAPDFALINQTSKLVKLVEVKYWKSISPKYLYPLAQKIHKCWNPCSLFMASLDGFYYDEIHKILENEGNICKLSSEIIPMPIQDEYLKLLKVFEENS